jgi:hypothetical protein
LIAAGIGLGLIVTASVAGLLQYAPPIDGITDTTPCPAVPHVTVILLDGGPAGAEPFDALQVPNTPAGKKYVELCPAQALVGPLIVSSGFLIILMKLLPSQQSNALCICRDTLPVLGGRLPQSTVTVLPLTVWNASPVTVQVYTLPGINGAEYV